MPAPHRLESTLMRAWMRRGWLACVLWPLSLVFAAAGAMRRLLYRAGLLSSTKLSVPVIVVGNVFVGGTGKTPLTIWLIEALRRAGFTPGVVSRGYGGRDDCLSVTAASDPAQAGDEPVLIASRTGAPTVVGRKRVAAARLLLGEHPEVDVIVSDDGLQHYAMARDVEIVLFDARGVGNGWLLPAGPLREPASRSRDVAVMNAEGAIASPVGPCFRMRLKGGEAEHLTDAARREPVQSLQNDSSRRIVAAAGIGNPSRFFTMLRDHGLALDEMPLSDHYRFDAQTFAGVQADLILITEKDAVKCRRIDALKNDPRIRVVPVTAEVDEALIDYIVEKLRGHPTA